MNQTTTNLTIIIAAVLLLSTTAYAAGVAINETGDQPAASAMLDVQNTTKGFGNTGIGQTAPTSKLDVGGAALAAQLLGTLLPTTA